MPAAVDFGPGGACVRCGAFACVRDAKGDAETRLLRPLVGLPNVEVMTGARVLWLIAEPDGRIVAAEALRGGEVLRVEADRFVLAAGAINSALILLRSADERRPEGLANRSGVVGRHLMSHHLTGLIGHILRPKFAFTTRLPAPFARGCRRAGRRSGRSRAATARRLRDGCPRDRRACVAD